MGELEGKTSGVDLDVRIYTRSEGNTGQGDTETETHIQHTQWP